jgi:multidrug transporter EmrE-like cation transporter
MSIEFGSRPLAEKRRPQESFWFKTFMHFSFYLMIAALVILGVEVAYALYQLANLAL